MSGSHIYGLDRPYRLEPVHLKVKQRFKLRVSHGPGHFFKYRRTLEDSILILTLMIIINFTVTIIIIVIIITTTIIIIIVVIIIFIFIFIFIIIIPSPPTHQFHHLFPLHRQYHVRHLLYLRGCRQQVINFYGLLQNTYKVACITYITFASVDMYIGDQLL
jgi:hypothetical protein